MLAWRRNKLILALCVILVLCSCPFSVAHVVHLRRYAMLIYLNKYLV